MGGLRGLWRKYKDWFAALVFICVLTGYTVWYLYLNPQHARAYTNVVSYEREKNAES